MIHEGVGARCRLIESNEKFRSLPNEYHVLPAREMRRRRRSRNGQNAEQCAVDMKRMRHSNRHDLPDLAGCELGLDIDTFDIQPLPLCPYEGDLLASLVSLRA